METVSSPLITNDAVVFGLLIATLAGIFITSSSSHPAFKKFYTYVPALLLCYFIPSLYNSFNIISSEESNLYFVASRYLLPASLVLLTLSIDIKGILRLGPKAVIMFLTATAGIMIGGPIAIITVGLFQPELFAVTGDEALWRGMSTIAGSWIGGGANQTAMFEVFQPSSSLFSAMVTVDILVANLWMAFLLYGAGMTARIDHWFKADSSAIDDLQKRIENYQAGIMRIPSFVDIAKIIAVGFIITAIGHLLADIIAPWIGSNAPALKNLSLDSSFFWIVVIATTGGLLASFTRLRSLEGAGASKFGSLFLYILVATIGMQMDVTAIFNDSIFFVIGLIWIIVHVSLLFIVGKIIKAPFFFIAVGSQANVGGAASAPVVASAFHPALAPVGVLLAVFGYALGTYGAYICALMMQQISASFIAH